MTPRVYKKLDTKGNPVAITRSVPAVNVNPGHEEARPSSQDHEARLRQNLQLEMATAWEKEKQKLAEVFESKWKSRLEKLEPEIVQIVIDAVKKICLRTAEEDQSMAARWVREGLLKLAGQGAWTVKVHPQDKPAVEALSQTEPDVFINAEVETDKNLTPGGAVIEGEGIVWDAQAETRLEELARNFGKISGEEPK